MLFYCRCVAINLYFYFIICTNPKACFHCPYLHPDHSWPMPPEAPRWRQTTRASWTLLDGSCWRGVPSCPPFASCSASPSRTRPISSAAEYASFGLSSASPGWAPCPAAAAPGSARSGWPWRQGDGTTVVEGWWRRGETGGECCFSSEGCTFGCGLLPPSSSSSFQLWSTFWERRQKKRKPAVHKNISHLELCLIRFNTSSLLPLGKHW